MRTFNTTDINIQRTLRAEDPESYEQLILIALYKNTEFRNKVADVLCWSKPLNRQINIFQYPVHFALFMVIKAWRAIAPDTDISDGMLLAHLNTISGMAMSPIESEDVDESAALFRDIMGAMDAENALAVVGDSWRDWSIDRSIEVLQTDARRSGKADTCLDEAIARRDELRNADNDDDTGCEFWDGTDSEEEFVERIQLSAVLHPINTCLGGGFGKKEHVIFVAPTGGGKTVMACQLAADMASNGYQVLLVTTEQEPEELYPRVLSCITGGTKTPVAFAAIKDGIKKKNVTSSQWDALQTAREEVYGRLHYEDWTEGDKDVVSDLRAAIEKWNKKLSKQGTQLDCVILDWIGGALTEGITNPGEKRMVYQNAATELKRVAKVYNIATISFAQAATAAVKKARIDGGDIAENKTIHHEAVAGFGISALPEAENSTAKITYRDNQFLYCFKSRKGTPVIIDLVRDFKHQRFKLGIIKQ